WWGRGYNRFNVVNITNITNINNVGGVPPLRYGRGYSNLRLVANDPHIQRAVSTVSGDHFGAGRYSPMAATPEMIHNGRLMTGNVPVVPTHASLSASGRPANPATLPRGGQTQHFFGRPANAPQPFANQAAQVHQAIASSGSQSASMAAVTRVNGTARPT